MSAVRRIIKSPAQVMEAVSIRSDGPEGTKGRWSRWSNKDLDPTPPAQRIWTSWSFFAFQFSIAFSPTTYNVGASLYAIGLNWWIIFIASSMSSPFRLYPVQSNRGRDIGLMSESVVASILIATLLLFNSRAAAWYDGFTSFTSGLSLL
jgi:NCS1 family nucleobase:cation symporter-1